KESLLGADLARSTAVGAGAHAFAAAAPRARPAAGVAGRQALEFDDLLGAARRLLELDLEVVAQVVAAPRARAGASAPGAEEVAEDVGEDFLEALGELEAEAAALRTLEGGVAVAVVLRAPLGIGEHLVGLVDLLEALLGGLVARITVGMVLDGEAAVGFFEFLLAGAARHAEDFVVVAFGGGRHWRDFKPGRGQ